MAKPKTNARARLDLAMSMMGYPILAAAAEAIAYKVSPVFEVDSQAGNYGDVPAAELLTVGDDRRRNSDGSYKRSKIRFGDRTWATTEYGGEGEVDDRRSKQYGDYFDHELLAAQVEQNRNMLGKEKRIADKVMDSSLYTGQTTAAAAGWGSWSTSNPILDIHNAKKAMWTRTGFRPNTGICSENTLLELINNDAVFSKIHSQGAGDPAKPSDITIDMLKKVFLLDEILVGKASINLANVNQALSISSVWSDSYFQLSYIDHTNNIAMPTAYRTFHWDEDGSKVGGTIEDYTDDTTRAHVIRVREDVDEQEVDSTLKQLITGIAA